MTRPLLPTLQRHLLAWVLGALLAVWLAFVVVGYTTGVHEADELTDGHLASVASLLLAQPVDSFRTRTDTASLGGRSELRSHDYQQSLSVVVWDGEGRVRARTGQAPTPPFDVAEGFQTLALGSPAQPWRVFSRWEAGDRTHKVAVLLSLDERDSLAQDIAEQLAEPGLWLLPVVVLVLVLAIRRGLRPLHALSEQVRQLDVHQPVVLHAPPHAEFQSMVSAINLLAERYNTALQREREVADGFAHELRTPLASLQLHASALQAPLDVPEREASLQQIALDAARAAAVLSDLLALARANRTQLAEAAQDVDLVALVQRVAAEYGQAALDSGHDLAVLCAAESVRLRGHPVLLEMAVRNLLENALAHTPAGTAVELRVGARPIAVEVCDNAQVAAQPGPARGILGWGLGHQVVRRVAAVHGGEFMLAGPGEDGFRSYRLVFGGPADPDGVHLHAT